MKKRADIDEKYKWDIGLFKTQKEIDDVFTTMQFLIEETPKFYGKFNDKDKFFEYLTAYEKQDQLINKFCFYLSNTYATDNSNVEIIKLMQRYEIMAQKLGKATAFVSPQMSGLSEKYLRELLKDKRAKGHENYILDIIRYKPHTLDEKSADLIAKISNCFNNSSSVFDILTDSEMEFKPALDSKNKPHKLDNATYHILLTSKDRVLRKNAFKNFLSQYGKLNKTFSELFITDMKADYDSTKLHNYSSLLTGQLFDEQVPEIVFENNIKYVNKHLDLNKKYIRALAKNQGPVGLCLCDAAGAGRRHPLLRGASAAQSRHLNKTSLFISGIKPPSYRFLFNISRNCACAEVYA